MHILKDADVHALLSSLSEDECLRLLNNLHQMLRQYTADKSVPPAEQLIHQPQREVIVTKEGNTSLFMPCSVTSSTALKAVTVSPGGIKGCINLFAPDGGLVGILNAEEVTAFRTSLAVMIPYLRCQQLHKTRVVVFGAGRQAEWHILLALRLFGSIESITVVNRSSPGRMGPLFENLRAKYPGKSFNVLLKTSPEYHQVQLRDVLSQADSIFCCTPATTPHFTYEDLRQDGGEAKKRFISLIGSYKPSMHEVDSQTLLSGDKVYVDTKEGCLAESGELIDAGVGEDQLIEIGELGEEDYIGLPEEGNVVFKCVGLGIMDLVIARDLLGLAREKGLGLAIDDF